MYHMSVPVPKFFWSLASSWSPSSDSGARGDTLGSTWTQVVGHPVYRCSLKPPEPLDGWKQTRGLLCDQQSIPGHVGPRNPHTAREGTVRASSLSTAGVLGAGGDLRASEGSVAA